MSSPCAACKYLRRKCLPECVFAPYFPPDRQQKFVSVHKVFGASNVSKLLNELDVAYREEAVNSLTYEADCRLNDPVYGCVGLITLLQHKLYNLRSDLAAAKNELANYVGPSSPLTVPFIPTNFVQQHPNNPSSSTMMPYAIQPMMGMQPGIATAHGGQVIIRDPQLNQNQQMLEPHQMSVASSAAREQHAHMLRSHEQHQQPVHQAELMRFNSGGFDTAGAATASPFNQMPAGAGVEMSSPLMFGNQNFVYHQMQHPPSDTSHEAHNQLEFQSQMMLQQQQNAAPSDTSPEAHNQLQFQSQTMLQQQQEQNYLSLASSESSHEAPNPLQFQSQTMLQQQQEEEQEQNYQSLAHLQSTLQQQPQRAKSDEGRSNIGPSR